jgi:hypothetical protein
VCALPAVRNVLQHQELTSGYSNNTIAVVWGSSDFEHAIQTVDSLLLQVMAALDSAGLWNDTVVCARTCLNRCSRSVMLILALLSMQLYVTADHGGHYRSHEYVRNAAIDVPILVMGGAIKRGFTIQRYRRSNQASSHVTDPLTH